MQVAFADPGWDPEGNCYLNNYNDYEFNASITAKVYFDKPVAIGEHPQFLDELDKVLTKISNAEENLKTLSKHFDDSVDDDDIPF